MGRGPWEQTSSVRRRYAQEGIEQGASSFTIPAQVDEIITSMLSVKFCSASVTRSEIIKVEKREVKSPTSYKK